MKVGFEEVKGNNPVKLKLNLDVSSVKWTDVLMHKTYFNEFSFC